MGKDTKTFPPLPLWERIEVRGGRHSACTQMSRDCHSPRSFERESRVYEFLERLGSRCVKHLQREAAGS